MSTKSRKKTDYQKFQNAASKFCKNPTKTNRERLSNAEKRYKKNAEAKGKSKSDISKTVASVRKCSK